MSVVSETSCLCFVFFFLMIRRPPRSTLDRSSAASDVYKRQVIYMLGVRANGIDDAIQFSELGEQHAAGEFAHAEIGAELPGHLRLSLIHISEPTRPY